MDDVQIGRLSIERELVTAAALLLAAGASAGAAAVWRRTRAATPWRLARCAAGAVLVAAAVAVAAWVGIAVLYVAWAMFPDRLLGLGPILGLASAGGLLLAAVSLVVRLLAGPRAPAAHVRVS